jgi:hypothetical protein
VYAGVGVRRGLVRPERIPRRQSEWWIWIVKVPMSYILLAVSITNTHVVAVYDSDAVDGIKKCHK